MFSCRARKLQIVQIVQCHYSVGSVGAPSEIEAEGMGKGCIVGAFVCWLRSLDSPQAVVILKGIQQVGNMFMHLFTQCFEHVTQAYTGYHMHTST